MIELIAPKADQVVIAIPSKGRLKEHVLAFLKSSGYEVQRPEGRQLQSCLKDRPNHKVVLVHPKDIPQLLAEGVVDIGFTGMDLVHETESAIRPVVKLGAGKVRMALMVPKGSDWYHPFHLLDRTVATPFPNITKAFFERLKVRANVRPILGASEGMPYLGIVDGIVDVVETGSSAVENELKIICDDIFDSECVCFVNKPEFQANYNLINAFLRGIYE